MPGRHLALVLAALLGIALALQTASVARADTAGWADLTFTGSANAYTGTMEQGATGFPAATFVSDSAGGSSTGRQSGASTYLSGTTPVGQVYGSSQGRPGVLRGNAGALDTNGAAAWFEPTVPLSALTFTFVRRAGFPVYQTWFAALAYDLSGTVTAPGTQEGGLTLRLYDPEGNEVASTTTAADGSYTFPNLATYDGYRVALARPAGLTSDDPLTRTVDLSATDQVVDFSLRAIVPGPDRTVVTGPDGTYLIDDVPAGTGYVLTATAPPGTSVSAPLTFAVPPDSEEPIEDQDFVVTADPAPTYVARGAISDEYGDRVPGVEVTVRDPTGELFATATSGEDGAWRVPGLPVGEGWTAEVTVPEGYRTSGPSQLSFDVVSAEVAGLDFTLAIVITATPPPPSPTLLDPTSTVLPPTPAAPVEPGTGPGDLADTGGPSGLVALLGLVLVVAGAIMAWLSLDRASSRPGG